MKILYIFKSNVTHKVIEISLNLRLNSSIGVGGGYVVIGRPT